MPAAGLGLVSEPSPRPPPGAPAQGCCCCQRSGPVSPGALGRSELGALGVGAWSPDEERMCHSRGRAQPEQPPEAPGPRPLAAPMDPLGACFHCIIAHAACSTAHGHARRHKEADARAADTGCISAFMAVGVTQAAPGYGLVPGFDNPSSLPAAVPALAASCFRGQQPPGPQGGSVTAGTLRGWVYQRLTLVDPTFQEGCHGKLLSVAPSPSPSLPGLVVAGESDVSSKGQGQGEEYLGGRIQPHPGVLQDPHLKGDGDPWSTDRPPAWCLLVQTMPSVPGMLPRAVCPLRPRDSSGPRVRSAWDDTASSGSLLLLREDPQAPSTGARPSRGWESDPRGGSAPCRLRAGRGPLHTGPGVPAAGPT